MNALPSERIAVAAVVAPGALTAGAKNSGWINASLYFRLMAVVSTGVLGTAATIDAKWQQADDASGTNAVDIAGAALTQIVKASGDNKQAVLDLDCGRITTRGKRFVRLVLTVGGAASDAAAVVLGVDPRDLPATANDMSTVVQVVSA